MFVRRPGGSEQTTAFFHPVQTEHHPAGDLVKAHISFISPKKCIAWCEGVVAIINSYKGRNLEVGEDYYVMVTYNDKDQLEFKMV